MALRAQDGDKSAEEAQKPLKSDQLVTKLCLKGIPKIIPKSIKMGLKSDIKF